MAIAVNSEIRSMLMRSSIAKDRNRVIAYLESEIILISTIMAIAMINHYLV